MTLKFQPAMGLQFENFVVLGQLKCPLAIIIPRSTLTRVGDI